MGASNGMRSSTSQKNNALCERIFNIEMLENWQTDGSDMPAAAAKAASQILAYGSHACSGNHTGSTSMAPES